MNGRAERKDDAAAAIRHVARALTPPLPLRSLRSHAARKDWRPTNEDFKKADIFALGLTLHYTLSSGKHPFSDPHHPNRTSTRETRIADGKLPVLCVSGHEADHLVSLAVSHSAKLRPSAAKLAQHPFFYSLVARAAAIGRADRACKEAGRNAVPDQLKSLEKWCASHRWKERFDDVWDESGLLALPQRLAAAGARGGFYKDTARDLVRFLRNVLEHAHEYAEGSALRLSIEKEGGWTQVGGGGENVCRWAQSRVGELWVELYE
jgi:hypothetical protein